MRRSNLVLRSPRYARDDKGEGDRDDKVGVSEEKLFLFCSHCEEPEATGQSRFYPAFLNSLNKLF